MGDRVSQCIAVAIIEEKGKFLISRRKAPGLFANLWELPGGRCRDGEDPAACVVREVLEETGLHVRPEAGAGVIEHVYPEFTVRIHAYFCRILGGAAHPIESQAIAWIGWDEIGKYSFPEANEKLFSQARHLRPSRHKAEDR